MSAPPLELPAAPRSLAWPLTALAALLLVWGVSVPIIKLGLRDFPPLTLTALRYLVAAPCFALLLIGRKLPSRRALLALCGLGALGIGIGQVAQVMGVARTDAAVATVIFATIPIFVVTLAALRFGQPIQAKHALGLGIALAGVAIVAFDRPESGAASSAASTVSFGAGFGGALAGDALVLLSAFTISLYYVLSTELARRYTVLTVAAWSSLAGTVLLLPGAAWELAQGMPAPSPTGVAVVLYLGLLVTVAGVWVWLYALQVLPARIAAASQYLQPLLGVAASAVLLGEPIGGAFGIGTVLVLVGIALSSLPRSRAARDRSA